MNGAEQVFDDIFKLALGFYDGAHALEFIGLDDALDQGYGVTLGHVIEVEALGGLGLDAHLVNAQAQQVGDAGAHLFNDGRDFGRGQDERGIDVDDAEAGDIGSFFPPGDPRWKDADSAIFLNLATEELQNAGFQIVNIDTTLILAAPKIGPVAGEMRARVADLLSIDIDQVSIKAKTPEGLNLDHVAQCHAVVLVERVQEPDDLKSMSAVIESQHQLEDVVEDLLSSVHGVPKKRIAPVYDTEDIT